MRKRLIDTLQVLCACLIFCVVSGCGSEDKKKTSHQAGEVVVFVSLDRVYSEPILKAFETESGIRVKPVYDAEAAKTTGLVNRLIARQNNPECDVYWSNEAVQMQTLADRGLLEQMGPAFDGAFDRIPDGYKDPSRHWLGFAGRARVLIYNTGFFNTDNAPKSLSTFLEPNYRGQGAIALPYFGTTFTHASLYLEANGSESLIEFLRAAKANGTAFPPGNGPVRDLVASGEYAFGLTDTDDAWGAISSNKPVAVLIPDAADGAVIIPNTVGLIKSSPNSSNAEKLALYLTSKQTEIQLAQIDSKQIPLGTDCQAERDQGVWRELLDGVPFKPVDNARLASHREQVVQAIRASGIDR